MAKNDDRVLTFFVSGALLAGAAACSKSKKDDERTANPGPMPIESIDAGVKANELHVNEGPMPAPSDAGASTSPKDEPPHKTNTGRVPSPPEPKRVNTGPTKEPSPTGA